MTAKVLMFHSRGAKSLVREEVMEPRADPVDRNTSMQPHPLPEDFCSDHDVSRLGYKQVRNFRSGKEFKPSAYKHDRKN